MKPGGINSFLEKEIHIGKATFTVLDVVFVAAVTTLAIIARLYLFPLLSGDFKGFLSRWMAKIHKLGGWNSLGTAISNYTSPYMYLMCLAAQFSNDLYSLKAISVFFDFAGAFGMGLLLWELTGSSRKALLAYAVTILCPTVMINSAWWCQCDMIYCSLMIFALLFLFKDKSALCCIFLGLAFSFKVQAVFLLPFILIMWLKGKTIKLWHLLFIPLVYVIMQVPAWIAGRPFSELMSVYLTQSGTYPQGTLKFPNLYEFLDETYRHKHHQAEIGEWGVYFSLSVLGTVAWWLCSKKFRLSKEIMVTMALFTVCIALYTLPHMHERYGFIVDLLSIAYVIQRPKKTPVAILLITMSLLTYMPFLIGAYVFPFAVLSVVYLGVIVYLGYDLHAQISSAEPEAKA